MSDDMQRLRRAFLPVDLTPEIAGVGITGTVSVQARQTVDETRFLLDLARENDFILGVGAQERVLGGTALEAYGLEIPEAVGADRNLRSRRANL